MKSFTMKQIYIILMAAFSLNSYSQDCSIGNTDPTGSRSLTFSANYLFGIKLSLSKEGTLTSINILGNNTGSKVRMALYSDSGGAPNNLIAESSSGVIGMGVISLSVKPTLLSSGNYWVVAIFESTGDHAGYLDSSGSTLVQYQALNFGDAMPAKLVSSGNYQGRVFDYSLGIKCGNSLSIEDFNSENKVALLPNPSSDFIGVSNVESNTSYLILNLQGQEIKKGYVNSEEKIDIRAFENGLYFLKFNEGNSLKFIKE